MSPGSIFSTTSIWLINLFLALTISVVGWNANREYERNDEQERRIMAIEKTCVKIDYMLDDLKEIKSDIKKIMLRETP